MRPSDGIGGRACFAEVAGVAEVLAGGPIRGDLQAHTAPAHGGLPMLAIPRSDRTRVERALDQVTRELGPGT